MRQLNNLSTVYLLLAIVALKQKFHSYIITFKSKYFHHKFAYLDVFFSFDCAFLLFRWFNIQTSG